MILAAAVLLSASCKTLVVPLSRQQMDQLSNIQIAQRHDALMDCDGEKTTVMLEQLKIIESMEDANAALFERAIDYLRDLHLEADFYSQSAKKATK